MTLILKGVVLKEKVDYYLYFRHIKNGGVLVKYQRPAVLWEKRIKPTNTIGITSGYH